MSLHFLALVILATLLCRPPIRQDFWTMAVGSQWLNQSPQTQLNISYVVPEAQYHPYWGSEILWALGGKICRIENIWIVAFFMMIGIWFWCSRGLKGAGNMAIGLLFFGITLFPFWQTELNIISIGLGIIFFHWLRKEDIGTKKFYLTLICIQIFWCNTHPSFVIGFSTYFIYALGKAFFRPISSVHRQLPLSFSIVLFISTFVQFKPNWLIPIFRELSFAFYPTHSVFFWPYFLVCLLYGYSLFRFPEQRKPQSIVLLFWWFISLSWPIWSIATTAGILVEISSLRWNECFLHKKAFTFPMWILAITLICVGKMTYSIGNLFPHDHSLNIASQFVQQFKNCGRIFHDPTFAPYLLQNGYPTVFCDERPVYSTSFRQEIEQIRHRPAKFSTLLHRWDIQIILLDHRISGSEELLLWLSNEKDWNLIYCDPSSVLFLKSNPQTVSLIQQYQIHDETIQEKQVINELHTFQQQLYQYSSLQYFPFFSKIFPTIEKTLLQQKQNFLSQRSQAYFSLGLPLRCQSDLQTLEHVLQTKNEEYYRISAKIDLSNQNWDQALCNLEQAWKLKQHPETLGLQIFTHLRLDHIAKASEYAQINLDFSTEYPQQNWILLWFNQAQALYLNQQKINAQEYLAKILEFNATHEPALQFSQQIQKELSLQSVQHLFEQSKKAIQEKNYPQAIALLKNVIQTDPRIIEAYLELGKLYLHYQDYPQAVEIFRKMLELSPGNLLANCKLAIALAACGDWRSGLRIVEPLLQTHSDRYEVREALFLVDTSAIHGLLQELTQQFAYPKLIQLSQILARHDECQKAIDVWEKLEQKIPKDKQHESKIRLGQLYYQEGKFQLNQKQLKPGLEYLQRSVLLHPDLFEAHLLLGTIALRKKDWSTAQKHFQETKRIAPLDIRGLEGVALVDLGEGLQMQFARQYQTALDKFEQYVDQAPSSQEKENISNWISNLQKANQELIQREKKMQEVRQTIEQLFEQGKKYTEQKQWEEALVVWNKILIYDHTLTSARFNRAICYQNLQRTTEAENDLQVALRQKPDWDLAHFELGKIYYEKQVYDTAQHHLKRYLQLNPKGEWAGTAQAWLTILEIEKN